MYRNSEVVERGDRQSHQVVIDCSGRKMRGDFSGWVAVCLCGRICQAGKVKYWDLETFKPLEVLDVGKFRLWNVKFSPDNSLLATVLPQETLDIWEVSSGKKIASTKLYYAAGGLDMVFIPGSNLL